MGCALRREGPHPPARKGPPQPRVMWIAEQKGIWFGLI